MFFCCAVKTEQMYAINLLLLSRLGEASSGLQQQEEEDFSLVFCTAFSCLKGWGGESLCTMQMGALGFFPYTNLLMQ